MHTVSEQLLSLYSPPAGLISRSSTSDRRVGEVTIVDLIDPLTREFAPRGFDDRVRELLDEGARNFAINLGEVRNIDSSGLGRLAAAYNRIKQADGEIKLFAACARVRRTLNRLRLDTVFEILEDETAALRAFSAQVHERAEPVSGG